MEERGSRRRRVFDNLFGSKKEKSTTTEPKVSDVSSEFSFPGSSEIITSRPVGSTPPATQDASPSIERQVPRLEVNPSSPPSGPSQPEPGIGDPLPQEGQLGPIRTPSTTSQSPSTTADMPAAEGRSSSELTDLNSKSSISSKSLWPSKRGSNRSKGSTGSTLRKSLPVERIGLFELTNPSDADIDVIAIHGLEGDPFETWIEGESLWLKKFLAQDLPKARIMTFGYDARVLGGSSKNSIRTTAETLLILLIAKRNGSFGNCLHRPIFFICHSLGGIVFKQALILAHTRGADLEYLDILKSTKAVAFLGVPHGGSAIARAGSLLADVAKATRAVKVNTVNLDDLRPNSQTLLTISDDAVDRLKDLQILTFYETEKLPSIGKLVCFRPYQIEITSMTLP